MEKKRPRILLVSAEAYPFNGSGPGEAAMQHLPEAIAREGFDVSLVLPKYRRPAITALEAAPILKGLPVPLGPNKVPATISRVEAPVCPADLCDAHVVSEAPPRRFPVYFVENAKYFDRERIYGSANTPYLDNDERFTFFCRAVLEFLRKAKISVDLIHCHDWPTSLIPLFLRTSYGSRGPFRKTVSVLTVHDPAVQGDFPPESFALTGLNWDLFSPEKLAVNGRFNFLNAGFRYADSLKAGSPEVVDVVRDEETGRDLAAVLDRRRAEAAQREAAGKSDGRFDFLAPHSLREYAGLYRHLMEFSRGGSHVR